MFQKLSLKAILAVLLAIVMIVVLAAGCDLPDPSDGDVTPGEISPSPESSPPETPAVPTPGDPVFPTPDPTPPIDENDLSGTIANLPRSDAVDILWYTLHGYWTSGDSWFIGFVYGENASFAFEYGLFFSDYWVFGDFTDAQPTGKYTADLTIYIPATPETEMHDASPAFTAIVSIDVSSFHVDGTIKITTETLGGEWHTYTYGGLTFEDALNSVS